jgi:hypothetical protein
VYQLYDNTSFLVKQSDGSRGLPEKGADGKYHVDGKLDIANREEIKQMFSTLCPSPEGKRAVQETDPHSLLRLSKYNPCCSTRGHCANIKEREITEDGWKRKWQR